MGLRQIAIRDETAAALEALKKKVDKDIEDQASFSDVIDALMLDIEGMDEEILLEQIKQVVKKN